MKVSDLRERLAPLTSDDEVVICVREEDGESRAYEPIVVGRDGWDEVSEIHLGKLISG